MKKKSFDEENNLISETGGVQICKKFFLSIQNQFIQLVKDFKVKINNDVEKYIDDYDKMTDEQKELENTDEKIDLLNEPLDRLIDEKYSIDKIFRGEENDFLYNFITEVCIKTLLTT